MRFLGADGPRWFVRGVVTGNAATDAEAAKPIEDLFANIVVVRDQVPRAPRDLLALTMPQARPVAAGASAPASNNPTPDGPEGATPAAPDFNPLKRGPEITEIR